MPRPRKILLVDDHPVVRSGVVARLALEPDLAVCSEAGDTTTALAEFKRTCPDAVLLDIMLEGRTGLDLLKDLRARSKVPVLMFSVVEDDSWIRRCREAGANGFVHKSEPVTALLEGLRAVLDGSERWPSETPSGPVPTQSVSELLGGRELEVFRLLGTGLTSRQVAEVLHISPKTVYAHRYNIQRKLGLSNAVELVHRAVRWTAAKEQGGRLRGP